MEMETRKAEFSDCGKYRYTLWRDWSGLFGGDRVVNFICLNPSTATDTRDDNTIRKCIKLAKSWGFDALCVTNLFAYRATDPNEMKAYAEPVGPLNDEYLTDIAAGADLVIAAWGRHGQHLGRSARVLELLPERPKILLMGELEPWHPLYLPDTSVPLEWLT